MTAPHRHVQKPRHPYVAVVFDFVAWLLLPLVEWLDDRTPWERVAFALKSCIVLGCAIGALISLVACGPAEPVIPGVGVQPSAVKLTQAP